MDRKPKVLIISYSDLGHGGIQSQIMSVCREIHDDVEMDMLVWRRKPAYYDEEFRQFGRIFKCPQYEGDSMSMRRVDFYTRYFRIKRAVFRVLKQYGPYDAVHCHKAFECAPCLAAASRAGVPVRIAHAHNPESYAMGKGLTARMRKALYGVYRRIIWRYATHMVVCSTEAADDVYGQGKGSVLCNSIDTQQFSLARYPAVAHTGLRLIHVGRFSEQKNQLFLVDVLNALKDRCPDVRLVMVGEQNDYLDAVKRKAAQKGLSESVVFLPHDSDIPALLAEADAFVLPSTYEGFGIVLLEAQAMGLPCFVSSVVTREVDCGLLSYISLEDGAEKWAEQIAKKTIVSNTRRQGADVSRFDVKTVAQNWLRLYRGKEKGAL